MDYRVFTGYDSAVLLSSFCQKGKCAKAYLGMLFAGDDFCDTTWQQQRTLSDHQQPVSGGADITFIIGGGV